VLRFLIAVILIAVTIVQADARIGETLEQCIERYGGRVDKSSPGKGVGFVKGGFVIAVQFYEGKADTLAFCKVERDALGKAKEMSNNEISQLLQANSGDRKWKEINQIPLERYWLTEDAQLVASYRSFEHTLTIMTKAATDRANAAKKAEEDKKLKGL